MIRMFETAIVFMSSGVTAGASGIGITADGRIIHIPGNNPEAYRMVQSGLEMASLSETISNESLKGEIEKSAARLVQAGRSVLENSLKSLPSEAKFQNA